MKKKGIILFVTFLGFIFVLFGCGKKSKDDKSTKAITTTKKEHTHEFGEWKQIVMPTCSEEGLKKRTCTCGTSEMEIIPTKPHTYIDGKCSVCGREELTEGFHVYYSTFDGMYHIDDYTGSSTTVRIPYTYNDGENGDHIIFVDKESVEDSYVSKIKDCNIKKLIIGSSYETIPENMFLGLNNLEEVVFESNVKTIGDNAFYNCPQLSKVTFNEDMEKIGFYAFAKCDFKELRVPYNLKKIDIGAFSDNVNLSTVTFFNNLTYVGDNAFNNTSLESIKIPYTVTYFGFQGKLSSLKSFNVDVRSTKYEFRDNCLIDKDNKILIKAVGNATIPSDVEYLDAYSFAYLDYSDVDSFIIPSNIKLIRFNAFEGTKFKSFVFNNVVDSISESTFNGTIIEGAEELVFTIPNSITSIGPKAFSNFKCKEIIIPKTVTELDYRVFENCEIETITIHSTTLNSSGCNPNWNLGIDLDYTTINIIDDSE